MYVILPVDGRTTTCDLITNRLGRVQNIQVQCDVVGCVNKLAQHPTIHMACMEAERCGWTRIEGANRIRHACPSCAAEGKVTPVHWKVK